MKLGSNKSSVLRLPGLSWSLSYVYMNCSMLGDSSALDFPLMKRNVYSRRPVPNLRRVLSIELEYKCMTHHGVTKATSKK